MTPRKQIGNWTLSLFLALASTGAGQSSVQAEELPETERQVREFKISVDGKKRGTCSMEICRLEDGTERMQVDSAIRLNLVVYKYEYTSSGTEMWKDNQLIKLQNEANFNGNRYQVVAAPGRRGMEVTVNGKTKAIDPSSSPTSYWRLPAGAPKTKADASKIRPASGKGKEGTAKAGSMPLLDSDKGRQLWGELEYVGAEFVPVAGKKVECRHYRISGDVDVNLWYDKSLRLTRQESVEEGHTTVLELVKLTAE